MTALLSFDSRKAAAKIRLAALALILLLAGPLACTFNPSTTAESAAFKQEAILPCADLSQAPTASDLTPDPALVCGRLANGFGYVLMENRHPKSRVSIHLYVRAGSLNETDDQQGIAHFLEHMQFNGSTHFPPGKLVRYFQSIGMQFGNDANAHTGFNETVYDIVLPAGDEESLKEGLLVMQDYAMGALLLQEEVDRERGVILSELRARDSADYRTFTSTLQFELPDGLIAKRMPIGKVNVIEKADRSIFKNFYDTWYRPENMVLVMVGDFKSPVAESLVKTRFGDFSARAPKADPPDMGTIDHKGLKTFYHHEPESGGTTISIETIRQASLKADSLSLRRRELIEEIADEIVQNRLDSMQKQPHAPFTSAAVGSGVYLNHVRYAELSADSNAQNWQATLAALEQTLRQAKRFGFNASEFKRVKKELLSALDNAVKEAPTRDSTQLARSMIRDLSRGRVIQSPSQQRDMLAPMLDSISLSEVHRAFLDNWPDDHQLVIVTGNVDLENASTDLPRTRIKRAFEASAQKEVQPIKEQAIVSFPYLPMPEATGEIASRETIEDLGITRVLFKNGIRLNLKVTPYKTNEVLANLIFGRGRSREPRDRAGLSLVTSAVINESGMGAMDTDTLERALAGKQTSVGFSIRNGYFGFFAESVPREMPLLFQLFYAHLTDPGFRDDAMQLVQERLRQQYQSMNRSIEGMMRIEGARVLAGGDTRFGMPPLEKMQAIDLNAVRRWIMPPLTSAPLELSIVGDFNEEEAIDLAGRYLGSLPPRDGIQASDRTDLPCLPEGTFHQIDVDTQIQKAMLVVAWPTADFWDIHRTRRLSVLADVFSERLRDRIREKLGASYSPYAFNRASRTYAGFGSLQAHISITPDQMDKVLHEVKAIAEDLSRNGITKDELQRALDPTLTTIKDYRETNGYWLRSVMTASSRHEQQFDWARSFLDDYRSINREEVAALAKTYLTNDRPAVLVIRPKS